MTPLSAPVPVGLVADLDLDEERDLDCELQAELALAEEVTDHLDEEGKLAAGGGEELSEAFHGLVSLSIADIAGIDCRLEGGLHQQGRSEAEDLPPDAKTAPSPMSMSPVDKDTMTVSSTDTGKSEGGTRLAASERRLGVDAAVLFGQDQVHLGLGQFEYLSWSRAVRQPIPAFAQQGVCKNDDAPHDGGNGNFLGFSDLK